jgi:ADP-ribosyl-[dinitrogen reductase] hydrolase
MVHEAPEDIKTIYPIFDDELNYAVGMFVGLAIGDAMGAPIEFQEAREPLHYIRRYKEGGFHNVSKGEFTDDTSMALAMADAFIKAGNFDAHLVMDNFLKWKNEGAYSPRGEMFDCGDTIHKALRKYEQDKSNPFTGGTDPMSAGNGGLMRLAPAILAARSEAQAIEFAAETTRLTHGAEEALMYSRLLAKELWRRQPDSEAKRYKHRKNVRRNEVMSGGYVKETYQAAWWAYQTSDSFERCIINAINRGHDSDTTGAVAGMIAGAMYGFNAIPKWMVEQLQWVDEIIFQAVRLKLGRIGFHQWLEDCLFSFDAYQGELKSLFGRKAVCINPEANYGGGSRQLWIAEGISGEFTTVTDRCYIDAICTRIFEGSIWFDCLAEPIKIGDLRRYDF